MRHYSSFEFSGDLPESVRNGQRITWRDVSGEVRYTVTPTADVTVDMRFFDNPDIWDWGADPPAPS